MSQPTGQDALSDVLATLWRRKLVVLLAVVVALVFAFALSAARDPIYSATSTLLIDAVDQDPFDDRASTEIPDVTAAAERLSGVEVRTAVESQLGAAAEEVEEVVVEQRPETNLVDVTVRATSPEIAAQAANLYAETFIALRNSAREAAATQRSDAFRAQANALQVRVDETLDALTAALAVDSPDANARAGLLRDRLAALQSQVSDYNQRADRALAALQVGGSEATIITPARVPDDAGEPSPARTLVLSLIVGFAAGVAGAFLVDSLDPRLRDRKALSRLLPSGAGIAVVPADRGWNGLRPGDGRDARPAQDVYGQLAETLAAHLPGGRGVLVCAPVENVRGAADQATEAATGLALAFETSGRKALLVDCLSRQSGGAHRADALPATPDGYSGAFPTPGSQLPGARPVVIDGVPLDVVPWGSLTDRATHGPDHLAQVIDAGREAKDVVVVLVPTLGSSGTSRVARLSTGVVLSLRSGRDRRALVQEAVDLLQRLDTPLLGVVLGRVRPRLPLLAARGPAKKRPTSAGDGARTAPEAA